MIVLMQVVLPAPLRPSNASTRPGLTANDTSCNTWLSPYSALMPLRTNASVAKIDLACFRIGNHGAARALHDHAAVMQHGNVVGEVECRVHVVLDHDDRGFARD